MHVGIALLLSILASEPLAGDTPHRFPHARAYCTDFVTRSTAAIKDSGGWSHLRPTNPTCNAVALPVPFAPDATFKNAYAFALDSGLSAETRLVVELADGLEDTPVAWGFVNRSSAQSVPHPATLESLRIDGGTLVAVVGREQVFVPTDAAGAAGAPEWVLLRGVIACAPGATLSCRGFFPPAEAPRLGIKHRAWGSKASWASRAWDRTPAFALTPDGGLDVR